MVMVHSFVLTRLLAKALQRRATHQANGSFLKQSNHLTIKRSGEPGQRKAGSGKKDVDEVVGDQGDHQFNEEAGRFLAT